MEHVQAFIGRCPRVVLTVATLAFLLPFAGKAFHIDDPLFIWAGRQMRAHPFNPYGFDLNWYGTTMRMADVTKNPPLACAYIALLSSIFGEREFWLHVGFLAQAVAVVLGTYALAHRFCRQPFSAALATLLTPVFLVSSTTLMSDVLMLALWVWATVWWLHALDKNAPLSFITAGLLLAACGLAKYFGLALLPLLFVYSLFKTRLPGWWLTYFLIPVAIFVLYEWWSRSLYGHGLLLDALTYAGQKRSHEITALSEFLTALGFTGGCFAIVLIFTPFIWPAKVWIGSAISALLFLTITKGSLPFPLHVQWTIMVFGGIAIIALALLDFRRQPGADSLMLLLWVFGTFFFCFYNWTINGRTLLPMAPAVAILLCRRIEPSRWFNESRYHSLAFGVAALISLFVAQGDYQLAGTARTAAAEIRRTLDESPPGMRWFQGHWGFQYYAQAQGLRPFDVKYSQIKPGDFMIIPNNNYNVVVIPSRLIESVKTILEFPSSWISTMNGTLGAGFYSFQYGGTHSWLPLPFAFHSVQPEEYRIERFK